MKGVLIILLVLGLAAAALFILKNLEITPDEWYNIFIMNELVFNVTEQFNNFKACDFLKKQDK